MSHFCGGGTKNRIRQSVDKISKSLTSILSDLNNFHSLFKWKNSTVLMFITHSIFKTLHKNDVDI